jgi:hypothetical protein
MATDSGSAVLLRASIAGLLWLAAGEEALLLEQAPDDEPGDPDCWSASATVAHISESRAQHATQLRCVHRGIAPPEYPHVDCTAPDVYASFADTPRAEAFERSRTSTLSLLDEFHAVADEDLLDPLRQSWLHGRQLWLQIVVRGFWQPLGHISEYYLRHWQAERGLALHKHAVDTARYLSAPRPAQGMAHYGLACAWAVCGEHAEALSELGEAVNLNPDLRQAGGHDTGLGPLRSGRFDAALGVA